MSIAAKQLFLKDLENRLGSIMTVDQLNSALPILSEVVNSYDIEELPADDRSSMDMLKAFIEAKEIEGRSSKTLKIYEYLISRFLSGVKAPTEKVTVYHIRSFLMSEKQRGIGDSTLGSLRSVLSSYFGWLHKEGLIQMNPCSNLGTIKCPKVVREPFSKTDIERMKEGCKSPRDKAIIAFLLSSGCRISEVCSLNRTDIDFQTGECKVLGKGNKERIVYLDSVAVMLLRRYLSTRDDAHNALFLGLRNERLEPGGVRVMLKVLGKKTGVANIHPHRFRRTLATNLISRGMPIQEVAAVLGHDKLDTTMRYVYLEKSAIKNSYRKYA